MFLIKKLLQGLLIACVVIVLIECFARVIVTAQASLRAPTPQWYSFSPDLGWQRKENFVGSAFGVNYQFDSQGFFTFDSAKKSNSGNPLILTFGDSVTFGFGVSPESSYSGVLESLLPGCTVINLAVSGYSSFQGYKELLKYAPPIHPALIIVGFGHNDRRYVLSEDDMDSDAKFSRDAGTHRWDTIRENLYMYKLIGASMSKLRPRKTPENVVAVEDVRKLTVRVPPESYRNNLINIARFSKEKHIPVIFLVLKENPAYTEHVREGIKHFEQRRYESAVRELKIAVSLHNLFSPLARKYLATAYEQLGNFEEAKKAMRLEHPFVSSHGGDMLYQDIEYNEIMRSVGRQYGIRLVEIGQALDEDPSLYLDDAHPNEKGHEKIARLLLPVVKEIFQKEGITIQPIRQTVMNKEMSIGSSQVNEHPARMKGSE
jgi:lysophospholipase L1-like esterase